MKRFLAVLFTAVLLFSLIACSGGGEYKGYKNPFEMVNGDSSDMMGYVCNIYYFPAQYSNGSLMWYKPKTNNYDIVKKHMDDIEKKYNCQFNVVTFKVDGSEIVQQMKMDAALNQKSADWPAVSESATILDLSRNGYLLPLDEIDAFDIHDESLFGPANITDYAVWENHPYMLTDYLHPERQIVIQHILAFNDGLMKKYGLEDLRDVYEQKKWTWSYFETFLKNNVIAEGDKTAVYPFSVAQNSNQLAIMALRGNGVKLIEKQADGNYIANYNNSGVIDAIAWYNKLITEYKDYIGLTEKGSYTALGDDTTFVAVCQGAELFGRVQYDVDSYGVLPYPCGPQGEYGKVGTLPEIFGFGVSVIAEDTDLAAVLLGAYCQPFEDYPTLEDCLALYKNMVFDDRDIDILMDITKASNTNWVGGLAGAMTNSKTKGKSPSEIIAAAAPDLERDIEESLIPSAQYLETYGIY